jgi:GNAT superfamily N-acetyltransferase
VLTPAEQSERAARGLRHVWRTQCGYIAGAEVAERDGLLITATRLADQTLNCAFVTAPPRDPEAALDWCTGRFHERGLRTGVEVRAGDPIEQPLAQRGFSVVVRRPAMTLHPVVLPTVDAPRVTVRAVEDEVDLVAYQAIQAEAFDMTPEVTAAFLPPAALRTPGVRLFLAAYDDVPCATAGVSLSPYGAGIVGVATLRGYRRRGLGRAVTASAVAYGATQGADLAWLYPSAMARPLYEGLGFRALDDVQVWVERRD